MQHPSPSVHDVYFYQTGMAAICKSHGYLLSRYNGTTVLFEIAFMNTLKAFENGPGFKFFGSGSDDDLHELQGFLQQEADQGRRVQAIWAEFPANPLLVTPNLAKLRELADKYDVVLAIDDTIGSWANIDITAMADLLVTSVTKSFNGYADAIAGSVVLNPASPKYHDLKSLFNRHYVPEFYIADAEVIEQNSRDYLWRTSKMNGNAEALVNYLHACSLDTESAVRQVHYPSVNPSGKFYKSFMRPATADFSPGYGCLFSVELDDLATTRAFYDNLNVHKGVHLGAPFTLAFAYTMCTYKSIRFNKHINTRSIDSAVEMMLTALAGSFQSRRLRAVKSNDTPTLCSPADWTSIIIDRVSVCTSSQQKLANKGVAVAVGKMQRCPAMEAPGVDVRARVDQLLRRGGVTMSRRQQQPRPAVVVLGVNTGSIT